MNIEQPGSSADRRVVTLLVAIVAGVVVLVTAGVVALIVLLPGAIAGSEPSAAEPVTAPETPTYTPAPPTVDPQNTPTRAPRPDHLTGPVALDPLDCSGECLSVEQAFSLKPDYASLQLVDGFKSFSYWSSTIPAGEEADAAVERWTARHGSPASCSFLESVAPVWRETAGPGAGALREQEIVYLGAYGSDDEWIEQYARVFDNDTQAADYLSTLDTAINDCPRYADDYTTAEKPSGVINTITPQSTSAAVAGTGWLEVFNEGSLTYETLQYGNLVVTTGFFRPYSPSVDSLQFADFVTDTSARMEALTPLP